MGGEVILVVVTAWPRDVLLSLTASVVITALAVEVWTLAVDESAKEALVVGAVSVLVRFDAGPCDGE